MKIFEEFLEESKKDTLGLALGYTNLISLNIKSVNDMCNKIVKQLRDEEFKLNKAQAQELVKKLDEMSEKVNSSIIKNIEETKKVLTAK